MPTEGLGVLKLKCYVSLLKMENYFIDRMGGLKGYVWVSWGLHKAGSELIDLKSL